MTACPSRSRLLSFERGDLSDHEAAPIEVHLQYCDPCRTCVDQLRGTDTDAAFLREALRDAPTGWSAKMGDPAAEPGDLIVSPGTKDRSAAASGLIQAEWPIPDYTRVQLCGEGAYGSVWAVRDRVGVFRALKILDMARMSRAKLSCRESTALETYCRRVGRHPYLIGVYHVGVVGDRLYYTMDLADNDVDKAPVGAAFATPYRPLTLHSVIRRRRITPGTAIEITRRLLRGLAKLHGLDLVHRDIKPSNIVFVDRRPKLADIGMVAPREHSNVVAGTPRYMPPDRVIDKTADTFALGKVLYEMIAGPDARSFPDLPLDELDPSPKWDLERVAEVLRRACASAAADRYASAAEMLDDLEACGDFPFGAIFDESADPAVSEMSPSAGAAFSTRGTSAERSPSAASAAARSRLADPRTARLLHAALRAVPWIAAVAALKLILDALRNGG